VGKIWRAKATRQLLFTSHNPNLVVNGDADLVVCCGYRLGSQQSRGEIKLEGAIDVPEVRDEITTVMEGGEQAFKLRRDTYGFQPPASLHARLLVARPPDYDESSARRDHQASAAVIALFASRMPSPTSPAVAAQCRGTRARAPGSHRYSSRVNGSGAVLSYASSSRRGSSSSPLGA